MTHEEAVRKVTGLMSDARICVLTTLEEDGRLMSRPMALQEVEFDGTLWFLTQSGSNKVRHIRSHPEINVSFTANNTWVSLSGQAYIILDKDKVAEVWSPLYKVWFPRGLEEPYIALIQVMTHSVEFWEGDNKVTGLFKMARAAVTGKRAEVGKNETVDM